MRRLLLVAAGLILAALVAVYFLWWGPGPKGVSQTITVQEGASLGSVAKKLEKAGAIPGTASTFYLMARVFGSDDPIRLR